LIEIIIIIIIIITIIVIVNFLPQQHKSQLNYTAIPWMAYN